jgi:hypothetical protein
MEKLQYFLFASAMVTIPGGLILLAARLAHRACKAYAWLGLTALAVGFAYLAVMLCPFAVYGSQWALVWSILAMPFTLPFEILAPLSFVCYAIVTSVIAAFFWSTVLYVASAIIILFKRKISGAPND